jgi:hypothetical protein
MRKYILTLAALAVAAAPLPAAAQFGGMLKNAVPGLGGSAAAAVDPDAFLAETIETTKYMMIAAHVLAIAADVTGQRAADANFLKSVQGVQDVKELNALKAAFQTDVAAINANQETAAELEARYAKMTAEQRARIGAAAYNFSLGMYRNVKLAQQAPELLSSIKTNPRLLAKAPQLKAAADLVGVQAKGTASMAGSVKKIMTAGKVAAPAEADSTKPKVIQFT